jgi:CheY-like chemotaxis protein
MTAHTMQGDREKCLQTGMDDFLPKPVMKETLSEILEKWAVRPVGQ